MQGSKLSFLTRMSVSRFIRMSIVYTIVMAGGVVVLIPLAWMVSTALKELKDVFTFPPQWIPDPIVWRNFVDGWTACPFTRYLKNTCIIVFSAVFGQVLSGGLVAYGFSRFRAPGRNLLFILLLSTMMVPPQAVMILRYLLFKNLGWVDTFMPLIIPFFFGGLPFYIFLLRQFMMSIPLELDEAAKIDGCTSFGIFCQIILPLSKPALAAVVIFSFLFHWRNFLDPLIYLSEEKFTLALGLRRFLAVSGQDITAWNQLMAVSLLVLIPPLLLFFFSQKYFIRGITLIGSKG